jgi:hypothetical protein
LVEVEVFVGNMETQVARNPGFDGVGRRTPFVGRRREDLKAARMGKMEFLCFDGGSDGLVSGRIDVDIKWEEWITDSGRICWRDRSIKGKVVGHVGAVVWMGK